MKNFINTFILNYDKKTLNLNFEGETFSFDLNDGDVGDFWHSFTTKDGLIKDINFHQEDETQSASVGIYGVIEVDGELTIDADDSIYIQSCVYVGNPKNYFG